MMPLAKKKWSDPTASSDDDGDDDDDDSQTLERQQELPHPKHHLSRHRRASGSPTGDTDKSSPTPVRPRSIAVWKVRSRSRSSPTSDDNDSEGVDDGNENEERPVSHMLTTCSLSSSLQSQPPVPPWFVCHTVAQAVESLRTHSFAVFECDSDLSESIQTAFRMFLDCLESHDGNRRAWPRVIDVNNGNGNDGNGNITGGLGLMGYNTPSPAKMVFRAYPHHPRQPWPDDDHPHHGCTLRDASQDVAARLHHVLHLCLQELCHQPSEEDSAFTDGEGGKETEDEGPALKRLRTTAYLNDDDEKVETQDSHACAIPPTNGCCPLDYYYYHNRGPDNVPNCTEHVDRGLLIAVCLTDVPGLEVRMPPNSSPDHSSWMCPEEAMVWQRHKPGVHPPPAYVAILAGDTLRDHVPSGVPTIPACVHRVRTPLTAPRLSISYELRPS